MDEMTTYRRHAERVRNFSDEDLEAIWNAIKEVPGGCSSEIIFEDNVTNEDWAQLVYLERDRRKKLVYIKAGGAL